MADDKQVRTEADRGEASQPRKRLSFGVPRLKLSVDNRDPNYHYRWVNDDSGRLEIAQASGYMFVEKKEVVLAPGIVSNDGNLGDRVNMLVGRKQFGDPLYAFLMKIPREFYEEDKKALAEIADRNDATIRAGAMGIQDGQSFYTPQATPIRMQHNSKRRL